MDIDNQVIDRASRNLNRLLIAYSAEIAEAFLKADDTLSVSLSVEFKPKGSGIKIKTGINFIAARVKESTEDEVYPKSPIDLEIERRKFQRDIDQKIGNTPGGWSRLRWYKHR